MDDKEGGESIIVLWWILGSRCLGSIDAWHWTGHLLPTCDRDEWFGCDGDLFEDLATRYGSDTCNGWGGWRIFGKIYRSIHLDPPL